MPFQGRSIQASVELDLEPLELSISQANKMLGKLGDAFEFKKEPLVQLEQYMGKVRDIFKMVSNEALKINEAFNNIQGLKTFIENLEILKAKMETIANDVDKINQAILRENKSATQFAETEQRINGIMDKGLASLQKENQLINNSLKYLAEQEQLERQRVALLNEVNLMNEQSMNILMGKATTISEIVAEEERELTLLREVASANEQSLAVLTGRATSVTEILAMTDEELALLREELALEEEILGIEKQQTAEVGKQNAERMSGAKATKGNQLDKMGYLPSRIGSMAVTMWGFNELMDVYDKTMTNINAKGSYSHFGRMLQTDERYLKQTGQTTDQVAKSLGDLDGKLIDLQSIYKKIDMKTVGANAEETAFKYGLQADAIGDLSEVMAIYGSEFVKQGRSQEDSILALNDALDGELRRLKEVNVTSDELKEHGWKGQGDQVGMIKALKEIAEERGYDVTAKEITNLSDAITYAELQLAFLLSDLFEIAEPSLRSAVMKLATGFEWLAKQVSKLKDYLKGLPQPVKTFLKEFGANAMIGLVGLWIGRKIWGAVKNIGLFGDAWTGLMDKLGRTKGMDKASESMGKMSQTTGGTAPTGGGNWKTGVKNWGKNVAKNIGKMAEIFLYVGIAIAMSYALLEEAMYFIARLGDDWEKLKPQFEKGWAFIKDYGVWILGVSAVLVYVLNAMSNTPTTTGDLKNMAMGGLKLAEGLAIAMGLIAEAIALLIVPMGAVAVLGWMYGMLDQGSIQKGIEVIQMYGDALNYIANDDAIGWFIVGLVAVSGAFAVAIESGIGVTVIGALALGIVTTMTLISEIILLLIEPLKSVEMLGSMASGINEDGVKKGSEAIRVVGDCLKSLEPVVRNLLAIDFEVFGIGVVEWGNKFINGKNGFKTLTEDILPSLITFVTDIGNLEMPTDVDISDKATAITQMATQLIPMMNAMQNLENAMGIGGVMGKASTGISGFIDSHLNTGLKPQLDQMYNDIKDVLDFATKIGNLNGSGSVNTTAISQTANVISQLKTKLGEISSAISQFAPQIRESSKSMGSAIKDGFSDGTTGFSQTVVNVLSSGITEVQNRYDTWHSGGKTSAQKLADGFKTIGGKLKSSVSEEMGYALDELDNYKDDFYDKGAMLGQSLVDGFKSKKALDQNSPAKITKSIREELGYSMEALNDGRMLMYNGGVALGQALANGYNSYGNLRTDVGVLASKGVSNEQLQATARKVQANTNNKGQTQQSLTPIINIDMSNSMVIGIQDLDARIKESVERAIISINSPNGAIGY